jgi:radical SAM protein with 4Fe4S-binding SPASM domain
MTIARSFDFFFQWHLTERCNLSCRHCYQSGGEVAELSTDEARELLAEVREMLDEWRETYGVNFSPSCNITGGEPLLRDDLFPIIEESIAAGFAPFLLTNGTLIDRTTAQELKRVGVRGVQVSMEGPEAIHDTIRGPGSFQAASRGVEALVAAALPVTINVTLSRMNAGAMEEVPTIARNLGATRLGFSRYVPAGQGLSLLSQALSPAELYPLYQKLLSQQPPGIDIVTGDPMANQLNQSAPASPAPLPVGGCAAAVSGITIMADGTLVPCRRLPIPIGNIRHDSLRQLWATAPLLVALRDQSQYEGKCASCKRWGDCRGCRAIAYGYSLATGSENPLAADPHCFID